MKAFFNYCARTCKGNAKQKGIRYSISPDYLGALWNKQKGLCAYSGLEMIPHLWKFTSPARAFNASLDRENSSLGYEEGNVRFAILSFNLMKEDLQLNDFLNYLRATISFWKGEGDGRQDAHKLHERGLSYFLQAQKTRGKEWELTKEDLLAVWKRQNGICPYTGIAMIPHVKGGRNDKRWVASLDRIDSNEGYRRGNVQFVTQLANLGKGVLSDWEFKELLKKLAGERPKGRLLHLLPH
jgi:hypothetical protein